MSTPDGNNIVSTGPLLWSSALPFKLESGGAAGSWYILIDEVIDTCRRQNVDYRQLRAWVRLSDGREVKSRRRGIGRT